MTYTMAYGRMTSDLDLCPFTYIHTHAHARMHTHVHYIYSDTVSRCAVFCSFISATECCKTEGIVDVFQVVKALRIQKPGSVLTVVSMSYLIVSNQENLYSPLLPVSLHHCYIYEQLLYCGFPYWMSLITSVARSFCMYHLYVCLYSNGSVVLTQPCTIWCVHLLICDRKKNYEHINWSLSFKTQTAQLVNSSVLNKATAVTYYIQTDSILNCLRTILLSCNIIAVFHCRNSTVSYLIWCCCSSSHSTFTQISSNFHRSKHWQILKLTLWWRQYQYMTSR